jgi:Leucine-rich repeat (LRR) protein
MPLNFQIKGSSIKCVIADLFLYTPTLQSVRFEDNTLLESIPQYLLRGLTSLKTLSIYGSKISTIPADMFTNLSTLEYINLGFNKLTTISDNTYFNGLTNLKTLILSTNLLSTIQASAFSTLISLRSLHLEFNPLVQILADKPTYSASLLANSPNVTVNYGIIKIIFNFISTLLIVFC